MDQTKNGEGESEWSNVPSFQLNNPTPKVPVALAPANGTAFIRGTDVQWRIKIDKDADTVTFGAVSPSGRNVINTFNFGELTCDPEPYPDPEFRICLISVAVTDSETGRWTWAVRTDDDIKDEGLSGWSNILSFWLR